MTIIAVFNQKGGVGKTTVTAHLAATLARNGTEPLVIDLDPQAHLTALWGLRPRPEETVLRFYQGLAPLTELARPLPCGVQFIPSHLELSKVDTQVIRHRDHVWRLKLGLAAEMLSGNGVPILIDCSPTLGPLAFSALFAADLVLVPVAADYLALNGAALLERTLAGLTRFCGRLPRRYLLNRYVSGQVTAEKVLGQLAQRYGAELLRARIHEQEVLGAAAATGEDIFSFAPESRAAADFAFLLDELAEQRLLRW
ncbi:ParA family protein [Chitiniphilus purpureus]|uniref:ParA family protein n=1 Tax=Chitiniphilus purpureus TaxID=2981137 RepID=A0ABY6DJI1_9NEIS|nr:ParA family protein [Chitiniphilus sp. CD1]UXY14512.1 ParA family protein [Chitiniphilus sp. CD1]